MRKKSRADRWRYRRN